MTNRSSAKQHGGDCINERRRKSKQAKRDNKQKARETREILREKHGLNC